MDVRDRVAIVTGPGGGLGPVVTRDLAAGGARLALLGTRLDRLEALASELDLAPDRWLARAADLADPDAAAAAVDDVARHFGRIDILVHLVGGWTGGTGIAETPPETYRTMLDRHFWTTLNMTQVLLPHLASGGWGRIVAVSSPVASRPPAKMSAYAVGKAAQEALLAALAREVAGTGTTVNVLLVTTIDTEHARDAAPTARNASWSTPEEISAAIGYLLSDEAGIVNGARIPLFGPG
jgi:NAD(P)-dependent dehydrogenase (short-subunit alcohol dehydrogenase family)